MARDGIGEHENGQRHIGMEHLADLSAAGGPLRTGPVFDWKLSAPDRFRELIHNAGCQCAPPIDAMTSSRRWSSSPPATVKGRHHAHVIQALAPGLHFLCGAALALTQPGECRAEALGVAVVQPGPFEGTGQFRMEPFEVADVAALIESTQAPTKP
jgi:hypothetical protein